MQHRVMSLPRGVAGHPGRLKAQPQRVELRLVDYDQKIQVLRGADAAPHRERPRADQRVRHTDLTKTGDRAPQRAGQASAGDGHRVGWGVTARRRRDPNARSGRLSRRGRVGHRHEGAPGVRHHAAREDSRPRATRITAGFPRPCAETEPTRVQRGPHPTGATRSCGGCRTSMYGVIESSISRGDAAQADVV